MHLLFIVKEIDNEPQGILLISSLLKQAGHQVSLVVATEEDPVHAALRLRPDVLGYTVYTGPHTWYLELNRRIRAQLPGVLSVFGGPHPTFFPEMIEREGVDGLCIGEGEYATLDLMNALQRDGDGALHLANPAIPNWWFKLNGEIVRNPLRPLLTSEEMDALPFADRELLYAAHAQSRQTKIKPFITGRGCPYDCAFCFNKAYSDLYGGQGRRFRRRGVDNVLRELQEVAGRHDVRFVLFMDDTFILQDRWLQEFMGRYKDEVGLPFWCQVRANLVTDEKVALFKEAGCVSVSFGLEAGNDHLRNAVLNRNMSREEILGAAEILRRHGVAFMTNNMLGLPTGSLETDFETLDLNARCRPAYANVFLFQPYPKTALGEWAYREGWMMGSFDDLSGSVSDDSVIRFGNEDEKRQIENLQKLFALGVELPWLLPSIRRLIRRRPNRLCWLVYKLGKGWAIKRRMFPFAMTPREYLDSALYYMRIKSQ
ncbi:MAG: radical SAM protein [Chloroflexi bacterium]|nr:MAG: radical SAM protein [Chloroflexota bacterium]